LSRRRREVTWALILGFALSAVIQAVVRRSTVKHGGEYGTVLIWTNPHWHAITGRERRSSLVV
jgi:hypothetical protein